MPQAVHLNAFYNHKFLAKVLLLNPLKDRKIHSSENFKRLLCELMSINTTEVNGRGLEERRCKALPTDSTNNGPLGRLQIERGGTHRRINAASVPLLP